MKSAINKTTYKTLGFVFLLTITSACEKKDQFVTHDNTTVEGVLLSAAGRSPIDSGKVLLLSSYDDGTGRAIWHGRGYSTRNVLTTDENGRFYYSFKHADDTVYAIAAEAEGYFSNYNSGGYPYPEWRATGRASVEKGYFNFYSRASDDKEYRVKDGIAYLPEIRLAPEGWIKYRIINQNNKQNYINIKAFAGGGLGPFSGYNINLTVYDTKPGGLRSEIYIYYRDSTVVDSIFVEPHDTVTYELTY